MRIISALVATLALATTALAEPQITAVNVYPPDINLNTKADLQRFVVVATRDDGVTLDVTGQAAVKLVDPSLCRLESNVLYPQADGQTTLEIEYQGFKSAATVAVKDAAAERTISFQLDIMPVFMRS